MGEGKMRVAVMTGLGKIEIMERPVPVPAPGEALVRIECVGICGSDLHYLQSGRIGNRVITPPFVLGHEACGIVVGVGDGVTNVKAGDRVALEPGKSCGRCDLCRKGYYNLCAKSMFLGSPPTDGVFREYVGHEAALCFPLPQNMTAVEGALIEPLTVGFYAAIKSEARIGMKVAVTGSGCIGLVTMMALRAMGVSSIYMTDIEQKRLDKALALGAGQVVNAREQDPVEEIMRFTGGAGCDLVIETAGTETTTVQAIRMTRKGASIMLVGQSAEGSIKLPITDAIAKELTFLTIFRYRHAYPVAIEAVSSGAVNVREVATHFYPFSDIQNAFDQCLTDKSNIVKAIVRIS